MGVPDGPGEAPEGLLGGCKMFLFFFFVGFYNVLTFSMHLVLWLIRLALGGAHVASEMADVAFLFVFMIFALPQGRRPDGIEFERR